MLVENAEEAQAGGMVDEGLEEGNEDVADALSAVRSAHGIGVLLHQVVELCLSEGDEDFVFVFKMPVNRSARHPSLAGDAAQGGLGVALFVEEGQGGVKNGVTGLLCFTFGPAHGSGGVVDASRAV